MSFLRKIGLLVPPIRDIWDQRAQAIAQNEYLSKKLMASHEEIARLSSEILEPRKANPFKKVSFMGRDLAIYGRAGDTYFDSISDAHTNDFLAFAASRLSRENSVSFDIGANVGLIASALSGVSKEVHSFEPSPATHAYLAQTLKANHSSNVIVNQVALGSQPGELRFFDDGNSTSASHLITPDTLARSSEVIVPVSTIDHYVSEKGIDQLDFIKIDIEGFEIDALRGGEKTIRSLRPSALVEFNSFTMIGFRNINPREFLDYFRGLFPHIYKWSEGRPVEIRTNSDALTFLHDHLVSAGCVDDLYGTFSPFK